MLDCFLRLVIVNQRQYSRAIARYFVWTGAEVQVLGVESLKIFRSIVQGTGKVAGLKCRYRESGWFKMHAGNGLQATK